LDRQLGSQGTGAVRAGDAPLPLRQPGH